MKYFLIALLTSCGFHAPAQAHDFWLGPNAFQMDKAGAMPVSVMVGHPEDKTRWALNPHRVISLKSYGEQGIKDHQKNMQALTPNGDLVLSFETVGTHVLTIETSSVKSVLSANKFNAYLEEEGLTPIKMSRLKNETTDEAGREIYSRRGKALINIGNHEGDSAYVTQPVGMTLEIVPNENPYGVKKNKPFASTVYYRGNPTEGITIGLISLDTDLGLVDIQKTNKDGEVVFPRPETGNWMLHAVWSDPLENNSEAEFDTIFSSMSFGFN